MHARVSPSHTCTHPTAPRPVVPTPPQAEAGHAAALERQTSQHAAALAEARSLASGDAAQEHEAALEALRLEMESKAAKELVVVNHRHTTELKAAADKLQESEQNTKRVQAELDAQKNNLSSLSGQTKEQEQSLRAELDACKVRCPHALCAFRAAVGASALATQRRGRRCRRHLGARRGPTALADFWNAWNRVRNRVCVCVCVHCVRA